MMNINTIGLAALLTLRVLYVIDPCNPLAFMAAGFLLNHFKLEEK